MEHRPSAAQVSSPRYEYSFRRVWSLAVSSGVGLPTAFSLSISRRITIRVLDERVNPQETQFTSQNPHSMHLFIFSPYGSIGRGLKSFRKHEGSSLKITPGFNSPSGSKISLIRFMTLKASFPHSYSTKGAMLRPVPCSAFSDPSYLPTTIVATSRIISSYRRTSLSESKAWLIMKWKLPSRAWPYMQESSYPCLSSRAERSSVA